MKFYYPKNLYFEKKRSHLFPLLKPFLKNASFTDEQRIKMYHISLSDFGITDTITNAEIVILPMSWNFYYEKKNKKEVLNFIELTKKQNKKVWSFTTGDFGVKIPNLENLLVFRSSGERTKLPENHIGMPSFIEDPLLMHFKKQQISISDYTVKPIIGFCGQSNNSFINSQSEVVRIAIRNLKYYTALTIDSPQRIQSASKLRARVLKSIKESNKLTNHFIERNQYRAGVKTKEERLKTTMEFYNNIKDTQYTVCIRGAGNFSVRLYEALAMGRIPVFINTDCILPLTDKIDWKKQMVWVEENELHLLEEKIIQFHHQLTPKTFIDLQHSNRKLWEEKLTLGGFFKTVLN